MISVVIPAHNEVDNLKQLLPKLEALVHGVEAEIIVSIGSCTSNYTNCIDHLEHVKLVAKERKGRAMQMNDGAKEAGGSILAFLHADVRPPREFFEDIQRTVSEGYDAGFFSYRFDKNNFFLRINAAFTRRDGLFTGGGDQCLFIKKSVFEKLGGFDNDQILMEDFEFFKRMKKAKIKYRIVKNDLLVSARKYDKNSYLRINLSNLLLILLFKLRVDSKKIKKLHDKLLDISYS